MMVVSLRCNLVFTCLLIIFIETLDSRLFDVEYAELYHDIHAVGSFRDGGVYYLFHATSDKARLIMYGQTFLYSSFSYGNTINDIYVEKFRRSDEEIIGITICSQFSFNRFVKMYFCLLDGNWFPTTSEDKNSFVGGPLNLQMDMERWEVHPIIDARIIMRGNAAILYYIGNEQPDNRESTRSQLWADDGNFLISPIYNFEKISRLSGDLPSSLIAPITSFYQNLNENTMTITLDKTGNREYVLKVVHANTKCGQSRNIITDLPKIGVNAPNLVANRSQNIVIDIAEAYFQPSNMVIFCRFKRGGWTYYQHSILPIHEVNDMDIKVIDSDTHTVIYHNTDDEFITYIEVFFHRRTKMRYVVVNIKRLVEPGIDTLNIYEFKSGTTQQYVKVEPTNVRYVQEILCTIYNDSRA